MRGGEGWGGKYGSEARFWGPPLKLPKSKVPRPLSPGGGSLRELLPSARSTTPGRVPDEPLPQKLASLGVAWDRNPPDLGIERWSREKGWRVRSGQEVRQKGEQLREGGRDEPEV